ncbi:MAG: hypothetical protein WDN44_15635 [Sphingomonas sp.]
MLIAGAALPALGQDTPESLLPPGFDQPAATPAPTPARAPDSGTPAPLPSESPGAALSNDSAAEPQPESTEPVDLSRYELPDFARHTLDRIGAVAWGNPSFPATAFRHGDGRFLTTLMRRLDAPVASRWVSIALRRALLSRIDTPAHVNGADFAAERAWLLLRMGESIAAREVVQDVDVDNYTPLLFEVAMQTALANGDPAGLCPIAEPGSQILPERAWAFARAMCAGLAGQPNKAGQMFDQARLGSGANDIDVLLAEKVLGAGAQGRRAVTVEWDGVDRLTAWRFGLATATGAEVPEALYATAGPQVRYWFALSPTPTSGARARAAELAAAQGVFSCAGLVDLYSEIEGEDDANSALVTVARDLRTAYAAATVADRIKALQTLWNEGTSPRAQYARLVLTARAAAGIAPGADSAAEADRLIASMLTAGLDTPALAWRGAVRRGSDGWAMLALADPAPERRVSGTDFDAYRSAAARRKAQLVFAGLAGLGRLEVADARRAAGTLDVAVGAANNWTRAIDGAARRGDAGTVALLAAVGMQSRGWAAVTPEALFHVVASLRATGMTDYARMIAVEAVTRG